MTGRGGRGERKSRFLRSGGALPSYDSQMRTFAGEMASSRKRGQYVAQVTFPVATLLLRDAKPQASAKLFLELFFSWWATPTEGISHRGGCLAPPIFFLYAWILPIAACQQFFLSFSRPPSSFFSFGTPTNV
jgi:hypothetical protein